MNPRARRSDLEEQWVDDELVIYDLRSDCAHCLSPVTAKVRELADGQRTVEQIHQLLKDSAPDVELAAVEEALDALAKAELLDVRAASANRARRLSRRQAVRNVATATAIGTLPFFVKSIIAPTPAQAQSATNGNGNGPPV